MYRKELSLRVSRSYGPGRYDADYEERGLDYPIGFVRWTEQRNMEAILELGRGALAVDDVIDEVYPVHRADEAYRRLLGSAEARPTGAILLSYEAPAHPAEQRVLRQPQLRTPGLQAAPVSRPATQPVRIGLIGPGGFATRVLVPALQAAGARLEVVAGGHGPSALAARRHGFGRVAVSEQELLTDPNVDAVVIATRHDSHARLCSEALEAGKHVFCEKPLALSDDELASVLDCAGRAQRALGSASTAGSRRCSASSEPTCTSPPRR